MAPKKNTTAVAAPASASSTKPSKSKSILARMFGPVWAQILDLWNYYWKTTSQQTQVADAFIGFLMVVGAVQLLYYTLGARDPFNAFIAGFAITVGQFGLTVALRMQTNEQNKAEFPTTTPERSFAEFIFGSLILHFFCWNYIN